MYQTPLGKIESKQFMGAAAKVFQHEMDHLDGLLLSDIGLEIDELFDNATEEERMEVINMYLDSLDIKQKEIDKYEEKLIDEERKLKEQFIKMEQAGQELEDSRKKFDNLGK
jgi:hypothetical protein